MNTQQTDIPRGGMWEKQALYGCKRLREQFEQGELFLLFGIKSAGEVSIPQKGGEPDKLVAKTNLEVATEQAPLDRFEVGTLSSAIADMVPAAAPEDFPVIAFWREVETEQGLNPATVLEARGRYTGE